MGEEEADSDRKQIICTLFLVCDIIYYKRDSRYLLYLVCLYRASSWCFIIDQGNLGGDNVLQALLPFT